MVYEVVWEKEMLGECVERLISIVLQVMVGDE